MKPSAFYTVILITLLYLLSAQRASAQDATGYSAITYDEATNTVRADVVTYPDYNVQAYYSSVAAVGLTSANPDGSDVVYLGGETIEGPYYSTAEATFQAPFTPGRVYRVYGNHYLKVVYEEWFYPQNQWMEPELRYADYYYFYSLVEGSGGGAGEGCCAYEISHVFHGPGPRYLLNQGTQLIHVGDTYARRALPLVNIQPNPPIAVGKGQTLPVDLTLTPSPSSYPVTITLTTISGTGAIRFDDNTTSKTITQSTRLNLTGITESSTSGNIRLQVKADGEVIKSFDMTCLLVVLSLRTGNVSVSLDNSGRSRYFQALNRFNLGTFINSGGTAQSLGRNAVEIVGTVTPSDFAASITLQREVVMARFYTNSTQTDFLENSPDTTSDTALRDDFPYPSGKIYDLDAPGIGAYGYPVYTTVRRVRYNFRQWATFNGYRVSDDLYWFSRTSVMSVPDGQEFDNDVPGDNTAGQGSTNTSWNLH